MTKQIEQKAHAKFSISGAERWLECPGSIRLAEKAPPEISSPYAEEGTAAHSVLEDILSEHLKGVKDLSTICKHHIDLQSEKYGYRAAKEMVDHALNAFIYIKEVHRKMPTAILQSEQKVDTSNFTTKGQFGTLDAALIDELNELHIFDFKYGAGVPVEAKENVQLIGYALGVAEAHGYDFFKVVLHVVQPRAPHTAGPNRKWETDVKNLLHWKKIFKMGAQEALKKDAPLKAGDHCKWCKAITICPLVSKQAIQSAAQDFKPLKKGVGLSDQLQIAERLESWIAAVRAHAFQELNAGTKISGYKLVPKRASTKWINEQKAIKEARAQFGTEAFDYDLKSPAQIRKNEKIVEEYGKKYLEKWIAKRTVSVSSGLTLAKEDDHREAKNPVELDFKKIKE